MNKEKSISAKASRANVIILFVFIGYPLSSIIASLTSEETSIYSYLIRIILLLISFIYIVSPKIKIKKVIKNEIAELSFAIISFLYLVRLIGDIIIQPENLRNSPLYYFSFYIGASLLPAYAIYSQRVANFFRGSRWMFWGLLVVTSLAAYLAKSEFILDETMVDVGRAGLERLNPIALATLGGSLMLIVLWLLVEGSFQTRWRFVLFPAAITLSIYVMVTSGSRGPILAVVGVVFIYTISMSIRTAIIMCFIISSIITLSFIIIKNANFYNLAAFQRILNASGEDGSVSARLEMYSIGWDLVLQNPLFGPGIEIPGTGFYPHNIILEFFMATGLIGGMLAVFSFVAISLHSYLLLKRRHPSGWVILLMFQFLISEMFSGGVYASGALWCSIAYVLLAKRTTLPGKNCAAVKETTG